MLVGITGPSGAGKGCVSEVFRGRGFEIIDADRVAREVVMPGEPALAALAEAFGGDLINPDGSLNRRLLGERAFATAEGTQTLNRIMHPEILRRMKLYAAECRSAGVNCVFDAPLLIESGLDEICDTNVAVTAPVSVRVGRLTLRDGLTEREITDRINRQHGDEYYTSRCEYVIVNDGGMEHLRRDAEKVAESILKRQVV